MSLTILVTGGAGYVGSHTILELLNAGHSVVTVDNLCNSYCEPNAPLPESLKRVQELTKKEIIFYEIDIRNRKEMENVFKKVFLFCYYLFFSYHRSLRVLKIH